MNRRHKVIPTTGWRASTYYTPYEYYHMSTTPTMIKGYLGNYGNTSGSKVTLGTFPSRFLNKTKNEGAGKLSTLRQGRGFLNWTWDSGGYWWLDYIPCHAHSWQDGTGLVSFVSAAADPTVMAYHQQFQITNCGTDSASGDAIDPGMCSSMKATTWQVVDEFEGSLGGALHLDLYIGQEDRPNFENTSPKYIDVAGVVISVV